MNKAKALKKYASIFQALGEHCGRWRDELDQEDSSKEYLSIMIQYADELHLEYDKDPHSYEYNNDLYEYQYWDAMGFELFQMIEKTLRPIILD